MPIRTRPDREFLLMGKPWKISASDAGQFQEEKCDIPTSSTLPTAGEAWIKRKILPSNSAGVIS